MAPRAGAATVLRLGERGGREAGQEAALAHGVLGKAVQVISGHAGRQSWRWARGWIATVLPTVAAAAVGGARAPRARVPGEGSVTVGAGCAANVKRLTAAFGRS